jgi:hypothetical protein
MVNGYKMVKASDIATPIRRNDVEESPMITWGKIEGEPVFIGMAQKKEFRI